MRLPSAAGSVVSNACIHKYMVVAYEMLLVMCGKIGLTLNKERYLSIHVGAPKLNDINTNESLLNVPRCDSVFGPTLTKD